MPVNASPEYVKAESEYLQAETTEKKIECLKKMLAVAPKHKSSENLLAQLKTRLKKLKYSREKESKSKKHSTEGIKKLEMQAVIIGKAGSGKSLLLKRLTNANPKIKQSSLDNYTTTKPGLGIMNYATTQIQLIENPAIESEFYDRGLTNSADTVIIIVNKIEDIKELQENINNKNAKHIIVFNNKEDLSENQLRRIKSTLQSKKFNYTTIDLKFPDKLEELRSKIFESFGKIRIYTKQPTKKEKDPRPIIFNPGVMVKDVAEKILKGFSKNIRETRIWGPSSKFPGQVIGLKHELKDLDIVEFKTR